ncbi:hypothetical protein K502DRAFT_346099 [Neoconidiobolus thromboides FSU 785]|nr:hypothetical protein K502DRAFT_346099 [Neoconidiobolus thromboides FSU 785]
MINENPLTYLCAILGLFSAILNILLVIVSSRMRPFNPDIKLILIIAITELLSPSITLVDPILSTIREDDSINEPHLCQFFGFFTMFILFSQFIFSSFLAAVRISKLLQYEFKYYWCIPSLISLATHFILSIILAIRLELIPQTAKLVCLIYPSQSLLSLIAFYHFILSSIIHLIIIVCFYIRLAVFANNIPEFTYLTSNDSITSSRSASKAPWSKKRVVLRIYASLGLYSICMLSGCIFYCADSFLVYTNSNLELEYILGSISTVLYALGIMFNPLLVITNHTIVNEKIVQVGKSIYKRIRSIVAFK